MCAEYSYDSHSIQNRSLIMDTMKCLLIGLLVVAIVIAKCDWRNYITIPMILNDEEKKMIDQIQKDCLKENQISPKIIEKLKKGNYPDSSELTKLFSCIADIYQICDKEGKYDLFSWKTRFSERNFNNLNDCMKQYDNPCKAMYNVHRCFMAKYNQKV